MSRTRHQFLGLDRLLEKYRQSQLRRWPTPCPRCGAPAGSPCFAPPEMYNLMRLRTGMFWVSTHAERGFDG